MELSSNGADSAPPHLRRSTSSQRLLRSKSKRQQSPRRNIQSSSLAAGFSELWPPNVIVQQREGQVLSKAMLLKSDHFPHAQSDRSSGQNIHVTGAANFRRVGRIIACGQPSLYTIRTILNLVKEEHVRWICLREEPVIYMNSRPFVLRELQHPFRNMTAFAGINWRRIESIESCLKRDVLREAELHNGNLLVHDEVSDLTTRACWEAITPNTVKTSREVYDSLSEEGYNVTYSRVPMTPESAFDTVDVDHITRMFAQSMKSGPNGFFVFNCQIGRGRSTLGMVVLYLLQMHYGLVSASPISSAASSKADDGLSAYRRGDYNLIRRLLRVLDHGHVAKQAVDTAIDACGQVHNIRLAILQARMKMQTAVDETSEMLHSKRAALRIKRYFMLICFAAYLRTLVTKDNETPCLLEGPSFREFMQLNSELVALMHEFVNDEAKSTFVPTVRGGDDASVSNPVMKRRGSLLGKNMILKSVYMHGSREQDSPSSIDDVPNFRSCLVANPLIALAQPDVNAIQSVLDSMPHSRITWINLCSEPTVFLNDKPYQLREYYHSFRPLKEFNLGLTSNRLYHIEQRLKSDVLDELQQGGNVLLVHQETSLRRIRPEWIRIKRDEESTAASVSSIETTDEVFGRLGPQYVRVPLKAHLTPDARTLGLLLDEILKALQNDDVIVFNCHMGRGRSTLAMAVAMLALMHTKNLDLVGMQDAKAAEKITRTELAEQDDESDSDTLSNESVPDSSDTLQRGCKAILSLARILKHGRDIQHEVDAAIDASGHVYNLRDVIYQSRMLWETARETSEQSLSELDKCMMYLERYALLICLNSYMHDRFKNKISDETSFQDWICRRAEITSWFESLRQNPLDSLTLPTMLVNDDNAEVYENHCGQVLVPLSIMKCDYFRGCQNMSLNPKIDGAPNFRVLESLYVLGTAVPTEIGVLNVLARMKELHADSEVVWTNLREEPVLYINSRPYVLRDVDNPYENLQHTGITTPRLEAMEKQLKVDVLLEAERYGGRFLLHDESEDGNLISFWVDTSAEGAVLTSREMFARCLNVDSHVHRIPITDEQAPLPSTFDQFVQELHCNKSVSGKYVFAFNCQMGRGRTTTGMILALLLNMHCSQNSNSADVLLRISSATSPSDSTATDADDEQLLRGNYEVIQALTRVLPDGPAVKEEVDRVIDICSQMQNLRTAILEMRQRADAAVTQELCRHNAKRALNYLSRYFYLIAFDAFLWQSKENKLCFQYSFQNWIDKRPEITNLLKRDVVVR